MNSHRSNQRFVGGQWITVNQVSIAIKKIDRVSIRTRFRKPYIDSQRLRARAIIEKEFCTFPIDQQPCLASFRLNVWRYRVTTRDTNSLRCARRYRQRKCPEIYRNKACHYITRFFAIEIRCHDGFYNIEIPSRKPDIIHPYLPAHIVRLIATSIILTKTKGGKFYIIRQDDMMGMNRPPLNPSKMIHQQKAHSGKPTCRRRHRNRLPFSVE